MMHLHVLWLDDGHLILLFIFIFVFVGRDAVLRGCCAIVLLEEGRPLALIEIIFRVN